MDYLQIVYFLNNGLEDDRTEDLQLRPHTGYVQASSCDDAMNTY